MATQTINSGLNINTSPSRASWKQRLAWFVLLLVCGLAIFFLGVSYFEIFPTNRNLNYNLVVSAVLLAVALGLRQSKQWRQYWQIAFALFIASAVNAVTLLLGSGVQTVLGWFNLRDATSTSMGTAIAKVYEVILIVIPILALTKISGADLGSIYVKRGNLKWWLPIGALVLFNFTTSAFLFFATRFTSVERLGAALGWGLVFSFANAFMEELWLRGIFLRRFEPVLGLGGSILVTSIVFSALHGGATYLTPVVIPFIVANTFTLGLACGYLMMKTDSIWGPVLIHAASDLFLFIAMLSHA